ncbi:MAG: helix-turn-helix transcriptional regulator [Bacteroidetes bacterium]|nr:helix-turn-helix transcriptional regulator [Bacteroidota bacterium]
MSINIRRIKNPLSVLLGNTLKHFRKNKNIEVSEVVEHIGGAASAYRMVESGYINLSISKVIRLLELECFHEIEYSRLSTFIVGINALEPFKNDNEALVDNILKLIIHDQDLLEIFGLVNAESEESRKSLNLLIFNSTNKVNFNGYFEKTNIIEKGIQYLTRKNNYEATKLRTAIHEVKIQHYAFYNRF